MIDVLNIIIIDECFGHVLEHYGITGSITTAAHACIVEPAPMTTYSTVVLVTLTNARVESTIVWTAPKQMRSTNGIGMATMLIKMMFWFGVD